MHQDAIITRQNADIVIDWSWGQNLVVTDFDPHHSTIFVGWIGADALAVTQTTAGVVISVPGNNQSTTLQGVSLEDLSPENLHISDASAKAEIHALLDGGESGHGDHGGGGEHGDGGHTGGPTSPPPAPTDPKVPNDDGGTTYVANVSGANIFGFDPTQDDIDFGFNSVHSLIVTKTADGYVAIDSPWSAAQQVLIGVGLKDLTLANFGIVGNEHLREDLGGVISWEQGVGPRDADTVYIRSHEYGVHDVVEGFDPLTDKISFLYFGTRERLSVEDTDDGLLISVQPTGQSTLLVDVELADLWPGLVEFHFDQVHEDNLEGPFGFSQEDVSLVSRGELLTPHAPAGEGTDGHQTRTGELPPDTGVPSPDPDPEPNPVPQPDPGPDPQPEPGPDPADPNGRLEIGWDWAKTVLVDFDPAADVIDFKHMSAAQVDVRESEGDLLIEVLDNGGHVYRLEDVQAEDLRYANLDAASYNSVLDAPDGIVDQLILLGFDDFG